MGKLKDIYLCDMMEDYESMEDKRESGMDE